MSTPAAIPAARELRLMQVILAPVISEKSTFIADKHNQVAFRVAPDATKTVSVLIRPRPGLRINDRSTVEGDSGTRQAIFTVTLSRSLRHPRSSQLGDQIGHRHARHVDDCLVDRPGERER